MNLFGNTTGIISRSNLAVGFPEWSIYKLSIWEIHSEGTNINVTVTSSANWKTLYELDRRFLSAVFEENGKGLCCTSKHYSGFELNICQRPHIDRESFASGEFFDFVIFPILLNRLLVILNETLIVHILSHSGTFQIKQM